MQQFQSAEVAELVDALDSKSSGAQNSVPVRLRPSVQSIKVIMYYTYAIKSKLHNYIYVGITNNIQRRLHQHNKGYNHSTKAYRPFEIIYFEELPDRAAARQREKYLKSGVGKELKRIAQNSVPDSLPIIKFYPDFILKTN